MILTRLTLHNFKNISEASLEFSPKVNCLLGNNGMGKSNLLDAVHYLSFCKSFMGVSDSMLIRRGEEFAMARADYLRCDVNEQLTLGLARGRRKSLKRGGKEYQRLSQHIGLFPLVMIAPQDIDLVRGAGEERRKWMDMVISQSDARYLDALIRYNRALEQRNAMLREGITDANLYLAMETAMDFSADYIHRCRQNWVERLTVLFDRYYTLIAGDDGEHPRLRLESLLNGHEGGLADLLNRARHKDQILRHTTVGPHRDDIEMTLDEMPMKRVGSQGQCKTFTIALRLAQYDFLSETAATKPLLLLDDIFDKLDSQRVERIMSLVTSEDFGQIFVTDTNLAHIDEVIARVGGSDYRLWTVKDGTFIPSTDALYAASDSDSAPDPSI